MPVQSFLSGLLASVTLIGLVPRLMATNLPALSNHSELQNIITGTVRAVGEKTLVESVRSLQFETRGQTYSILANGTMRIESALARPKVYESFLAKQNRVTRNRLGTEQVLDGSEAERISVLGRFYGGLFTLKPFSQELKLLGTKPYGTQTMVLLNLMGRTVQVTFHVNTKTHLVERVVFASLMAAESGVQWSYDFSDHRPEQGLMLPHSIFSSQIGTDGTGSPGPQTLQNVRFNPDLTAQDFAAPKVDIGAWKKEGETLVGEILFPMFDDDLFVWIFTNWGLSEIQMMGWQPGDILLINCGGIEFESTFFFIENQVNKPSVYQPGNSLFYQNPVRFPMFMVQFNQLSPKERFEELKAAAILSAPIKARRVGLPKE